MGDCARAVGRKVDGVLLFPYRSAELGPHLTQYGLGRGILLYQVASWSIHPFGHCTPTLQTDRTNRQLSDSIGRTVFTNGRPKTSDAPTSSLRITDRSYRYASPCLWNRLPGSVRQPRTSFSICDSSPPAPVSFPKVLDYLISLVFLLRCFTILLARK